MEAIHKFIESRATDLFQIYITERSSRGNGILTITNTGEKINCVYLEDTQIPGELLGEVVARRDLDHNAPELAYFYLCADDNAQLLEYNLRT
jgi:hypothetical protein